MRHLRIEGNFRHPGIHDTDLRYVFQSRLGSRIDHIQLPEPGIQDLEYLNAPSRLILRAWTKDAHDLQGVIGWDCEEDSSVFRTHAPLFPATREGETHLIALAKAQRQYFFLLRRDRRFLQARYTRRAHPALQHRREHAGDKPLSITMVLGLGCFILEAEFRIVQSSIDFEIHVVQRGQVLTIHLSKTMDYGDESIHRAP